MAIDFLIKRIRKKNRVLQIKIKHRDFTSKLDEIKRKITKTKTNRYTSRLDGVKMKLCKVTKNILTIINVYAPTTALIRKDNTILNELTLI